MNEKTLKSLVKTAAGTRELNPMFLDNKGLTDWEDEPTLTKLSDDLQKAKEYHQKVMSRIVKWNDAKNATGAYAPIKKLGKSQLQPLIIRKFREWKAPALKEPFLENQKIFNVVPRSWEDTKSAEQHEAIINYQFNTQIDRIGFIDNYVNTCLDDGTVIVKISWDRKTMPKVSEEPIYAYVAIEEHDSDLLAYLNQALDLKETNPNAYNMLPPEQKETVEASTRMGIPVLAQIIDYAPVEKEIVICNKPKLQIIDPNYFYVDPTSGVNLEDAKFVVNSFLTSKAELVASGIYQNIDKITESDMSKNDFSGGTSLDSTSSKNFNFTDNSRRQFLAYEYWGYYPINGEDKPLVPIVATWVGKTLIRMEISPYPDGKYPFVVVPYSPLRNEVYGESDAELLADSQQTVGAIYRANIDIMARSAAGQIGFAREWLDDVNKKRFSERDDFEFDANLPLETAIYSPPVPPMSDTMMTMLNIQNADAESLAGKQAFGDSLSSNMLGEIPTAQKGVMSSVARREMSSLRRLAFGLKRIAEKIINLNIMFLTENDTIRITNEKFVNINPDNLQGNFDLIVDISTIDIDEQKANDLLNVLKTVGDTLPFPIIKNLYANIAKLKRLPELAHFIAGYEPEPDPMQQEAAQLELAKAKAEVEKIQIENQIKAATLEGSTPYLTTQKLMNEIRLLEAQAKKLQSESDKKDLDYLEQETGIAHVRDMEKIESQAQSNQDYVITKALAENKQLNAGAAISSAIGYNAMSQKLRDAKQQQNSLRTIHE